MDEIEEDDVEELEEDKDKKMNLPELRSLNCDIPYNVEFISKTRRRVDLFWIDYQGKRVKYTTIEPSTESEETPYVYQVTTYATHPWLFRDADTGSILHGNGREMVLFTDKDDNERTYRIGVGIPVYRLVDRCIEEFAKLSSDSVNIAELELPVCLKMELLTHQMNRNIPFDVYEGMET